MPESRLLIFKNVSFLAKGEPLACERDVTAVVPRA